MIIPGHANTGFGSRPAVLPDEWWLAVTNRDRAIHAPAAPPLTLDRDVLGWKAKDHAQDLVVRGSLYHQPLKPIFDDAPHLGWLAENVGRGSNANPEVIQTAFINSPGHYANIVNPKLDRVGVGVVIDGRTHWVALVFGGPFS